MAQAANIVLADAQATPVNHTFIPLGPMDGYDMVLEDQSQAASVGYWRIGVRLVRPRAKVAGQVMRAKIVLMEPVLEAIAPAASGLTQPPTVAYVPQAITEYVMSDRSSLAQRKDLRKMNADLQNNSQIIAMVETLSNMY